MPYTLMDHTADIGIRVFGETMAILFQEAGHAMFDQITDRQHLTGNRVKRIAVTGVDRPDLLFSFLRELLYFWTIDACLVKSVRVLDIHDDRLTAEAAYDEYSQKHHEIIKDIKAVTYHGLSVDETTTGWRAAVIFDV